jgi:aspartate 1-decarboxylase
MLKVVRAKLHAIRVTGADLNYHGSSSVKNAGQAG